MSGSSRFQRLLLPGFAFNAFVIGGGYATGRELAEFFLPAGPWGGLLAMGLTTLIWSIVCAVTFLYARTTGSEDYRVFFRNLLGPGWVVFELLYLGIIVLILAVFGAVAGALGEAMLGWPTIAGTLVLVACIAGITAFGNESVERLFKYATLFLFAVYAVFVIAVLTRFGDRISAGFAAAGGTGGWVSAGFTYASYNVLAAIAILPVVRHMTSSRDAVVAGVLAGPIAIIPALAFFICMVGWHPGIGNEVLPADFILRQLGLPLLHASYQLMIFLAVLETGVSAVHAFNQRVSNLLVERRGCGLRPASRLAIAGALLIGAIFAADRFGLVALIAKGYRASAWIALAIFVLPLLTLGVWRLARGAAASPETA